MDELEIKKLIKEKVLKGDYQLKLHALQRINKRGILPHEIKETLLDGKIIENYPEDKRGHSCLVWGVTPEGKNLHVVCGISLEMLWIITIYEPDPLEWETPEKRRVLK
jgi:hypothetical protein